MILLMILWGRSGEADSAVEGEGSGSVEEEHEGDGEKGEGVLEGRASPRCRMETNQMKTRTAMAARALLWLI